MPITIFVKYYKNYLLCIYSAQYFYFMLKDNKTVQFSDQQRQPLPFLQRKKIGAQSYVSQRLNRIRKQRAKQIKQKQKTISEEQQRVIQIRPLKMKEVQQIRQLKKNFILSSNKVVSNDQVLCSFEPFRKQLELLRKKPSNTVNYQQVMSNLHPFSSALRELQAKKVQKQRRNLVKSIQNSPGSGKLYRSIQKKKLSIIKASTKPISETRMNYQQAYFLNVGRVNLLDEKKNKKLSQAYHSSFADKRSSSYSYYDSDLQIAKQEQQDIQYLARINFSKSRLKQKTQLKQFEGSQQLKVLEKQLQVDQKQQNCQKQEGKQEAKKQLNLKVAKRKKKLTNIPFQTYYYRTFLWKVNYTNLVNVQVPQQYEHRLRVYIGKGNNSGLVRGLIKRRIWFAITDKIQQANFVWTQLKSLPYFSLQDNSTNTIGSMESEEQKQVYNPNFLTKIDQKQMRKYLQNYIQSEQRADQRLLNRSKCFNSKFTKIIKIPDIKSTKMHNHLINNYVIGNKKALFHTMSSYYAQKKQDVFEYLPLTFHIKQGLQDQSYFRFLKYYYNRAKQIKAQSSKCKNIWIVKPGQNSNRGNGINVCLDLQQIKAILKKKQMYPDGTYRTYIVQAYIQKPLLYNKRKFDLRHYMMISCINGVVKGYWYRQGYVRTTSTEYSLGSNSSKIHLTNDAVQKHLPDYGKFQKGNKLSYDDLQAYIKKISSKKNQPISFRQHILPKMKKIATDAIRACSGTIDPQRKESNFQIFGLDYMIDSDFKLYLIEINTNPCLQLSCPILGIIIPKMLQNTLQMTLDTHFPPPVRYYPKGMHYFKNLQQQNRYQLVYDSRFEGLYKCGMNVLDQKLQQEQDDTFQDDGEQFDPED